MILVRKPSQKNRKADMKTKKVITDPDVETALKAIFGEKDALQKSPGEKKPMNPEVRTTLKERLAKVLGTLTERERKVFELRFGLSDGYARTLEETGKQFRVTRERIRQIEAKALRKMRHPSRIKHLPELDSSKSS